MPRSSSRDEGRGVGDTGLAVYLDFKDAIQRLGVDIIKARYGNLFEMYERITAEDPYKVPMRIYPAIHYTMGGLWVDYNLESTIPGLFVLGEANFSDHGANRLGASALMQGLADGYFVAPYTVANYLASTKLPTIDDRPRRLQGSGGAGAGAHRQGARHQRQADRPAVPPPARPHHVGLRRHGAQRRRAERSAQKIRTLRDEFWQDVTVPGEKNNLNPMLDYAGRVADYMEFGELLTLDALHRNESCGGHFREEFQTPDGEALRDDDQLQLRGGLGVHRRRDRSRRCTRNRSPSTKRTRRSGATMIQSREDQRLALEFHALETIGVCEDDYRKSQSWRQPAKDQPGRLVDYVAKDISTDMSFLEMLDVVNEDLIRKGEDAIAFDSDCREGICGACGCVINGVAHGPDPGATTCQLHMRRFKDGQTIVIEPWRAKASRF